MKIALLIARILLGLVFTVFGANGFLHFIPMGAPPPGLAGQFMGALIASHLFYFVAALELVGGLLLLSGRYIPLALVLLGPVIVNVLLYHSLMEPKGLPIALVVTVLWFVCFYGVRTAFAGIFPARA
jgi:putative oxidoreductase